MEWSPIMLATSTVDERRGSHLPLRAAAHPLPPVELNVRVA
jgi:hypothetical protein